ncbi:hypothetical protein UFOVP1636_267 [uncultured Caudovirales phage]|uniref:Uncharacterized protein n=1 Tax=uncultured Caudovirales phage TaxID=2100421 RepID=A0A6J5T313_9CAUD|nr:hypothetical protein UFOVP1636_267 [uncultured Caudovirales phage]
MQVRETETKRAGFYAWGAARDAAIKSYAASTTYSDAQKLKAERVKLGLELCYHSRAIRINFRNKWITVHIEEPQVRDVRNLALLEADYELQGISKSVNKDGDISYRIMRA